MPCPYHHTYTNNKATARPEEHMKSYRLVSVYINKNLFGFAWIKVTFQNWTIPSPRTFILLHGRNVLLFVGLARRSVSTLEVSTGNETNLETNRNCNFEIFVLGQQQLAELGSSYANKLINHIKNEMHNKEQNFETNMFLVRTLSSRFSLSWGRLLHFTLLVRIAKRSHRPAKAQLPNHTCHSLCSHRGAYAPNSH